MRPSRNMENTWPRDKVTDTRDSARGKRVDSASERGGESRPNEKAMPRVARTIKSHRYRATRDWGHWIRSKPLVLGACQLRAVATIKSRRRWRTTRVTQIMRRTGRRTWNYYRCRRHRPRHRHHPRRQPEVSMMSSRSYRSPMIPRAAYGASRVQLCKSSPTRRRTCFSTVCLAAYFPQVTPISMALSLPSKRDLKYLRKQRVCIMFHYTLNTIYMHYITKIDLIHRY